MRRSIPEKGERIPVLELDSFLPYRLSVLSNTVSSAIASSYSARFGLSIPEWRVMAVLGRYPKLSSADIALRTAMDKVQVSRAVARLLKSKRIERVRDAGDGRVWRLELTQIGRAVYAQIVPLALSFERKLTETLSARDRAEFSRLVDVLTRVAREQL
jgi:DNA-binding MarR family transcriptional regulator